MDAKITEYRDVNPRRKYATPDRVRTVNRWKKQRATQEYADYLNRECPVGSADAFKESGIRNGGNHPTSRRNLLKWIENAARKNGWGKTLSDKRASIRQRWGLPQWHDLGPRKYHGARIEPFYTGMFGRPE